MKLARRLGNFGIAALAAAITSVALHASLPFPEIEQVSAKLRQFQRGKERITAVFLGSSHIHAAIDPARFDARLQSHGIAAASFNFGISAMGPPESLFLARQILAEHPPALRQMFIELAPLLTSIQPTHVGTARSVYWHDLRHTLAECRLLLADLRQDAEAEDRTDTREDLRDLAAHLALLVKNHANLGRAAEWWQTPDRKAERKAIGKGRDGFLPYRATVTMEGGLRERYRKLLERLREPRQDARPLAAEHEAQFVELGTEARRRGVELILLSPPNPRKPRLFTGGAPLRYLDFTDPDVYPALYMPGHRSDIEHLNGEGARAFTDLFADAVAFLIGP